MLNVVVNKHNQAVWFNYLFSGVVLVIQPWLLSQLELITYQHTTNWFVGIICLVAVVADLYAVWVLLPTIQNQSPMIFIVWMMHMVLTTVLLFHTGNAFGAVWLGMTLIVINVFKELAILFRLMDTKPRPVVLVRQALVAELALALAAAVGSAGFIGLIFSASAGSSFNMSWSLIVDLPASLLLFAFGFFPLRLPYTLAELANTKAVRWATWSISVLLAWAVSIYPILQRSGF